MITGTTLKELTKCIGELDIWHDVFRFPITHRLDGVFAINDYSTCYFTTWGLDYIAYRTKGSKPEYRRMFFSEEYDELAKRINDDWKAYREGKGDRDLIAAAVGGRLVGLMTNYVKVSHTQIVRAIITNKLRDYVNGWSLDLLSLTIQLDFSTIDPAYGWTFKITNGHSGHVAFGYSATFTAGDFEFDIPLSSRTRHLSKVGDTLDNLKSMFEAARDAMFVDTMRRAMFAAVLSELRLDFPLSERTKRQSDIFEALEERFGSLDFFDPSANALDLAVWLGEWTSKRGYKVASSQLLNALMKSIFPDSK